MREGGRKGGKDWAGQSQSEKAYPAGALPTAPWLIPLVWSLRQQRQAQHKVQMCSVCYQLPGLIAKGHVKLPSDEGGLVDKVFTTELQ